MLIYMRPSQITKRGLLFIYPFLVLALVSCKNVGVENKMNSIELKYDFKIFSAPAIRKIQSQNAWSFSVVRGETNQDNDKITSVDSYLYNGNQLLGFPIIQETPYRIPPAYQVGSADINNDNQEELIVVDIHGMVWAVNEQGKPLTRDPTGNPHHSFLAWPPSVLPGDGKSGKRLLLISRDFAPKSASINGIDVIDGNGVSLPGYPVSLPGFPNLHPPIFEPAMDKLYVLLESNAIAGTNLMDGSLLPGFPVQSVNPDAWNQATYFAPWKQLVLSSKSNFLTSIDPASGKQSELKNLFGERFVGLDSSDTHLYAVDDKAGLLVRFDDIGARVEVPLNLPEIASKVHLRAVKPQGASNTYVFILSTISGNPDDKVEPLFDQHAPEDVKEDIVDLTQQSQQQRFGKGTLTAMQIKEVDDYNLSMKRGYLENTLGMKKLEELLTVESQTQIQLVIDKPDGMSMELNEAVKNYSLDTNFSHTDTLLPSLHIDEDSKSLHFVVPLNYADYDNTPEKEFQSLVKIYEIPYQ